MSHPDLETFVIETDGRDLTAGEVQFLNMWQDETAKYIQEEAVRLGIPEKYMADIFYLRTRSRWTQEKEDHLIHLAKSGKPFPNILSGEF